MQVEAIYSQGRIEFTQPLRLKHDHIRLVVIVPDDEIDSGDAELLPIYDLNQFSDEIRQEVLKLQAISNDINEMSLNNIEGMPETEDQKLRWQATELRNELRKEQGRGI